MFSILQKKKIVVPHVRMTGVIGSVGRFKQGIELANQQDILKKAFSYKKSKNRCNLNQFSWRIPCSITFNL